MGARCLVSCANRYNYDKENGGDGRRGRYDTSEEEFVKYKEYKEKFIKDTVKKYIYRWRLMIAICAEHDCFAASTFSCECASPGGSIYLAII